MGDPSRAAAVQRLVAAQGEVHRLELLAEMARITGLPLRFLLDDQEILEVTKLLCKPEFLAANPEFRLTTAQASGAMEFFEAQGLYGPIPVGEGKTLLLLLCAKIAWERFKHRKIMILAHTQAYLQFLNRDVRWARARVSFPFRVIGMGKISKIRRKALVDENCPGVYLVPYSLVSQQDFETGILLPLKVTCILADEGHNLKEGRSARTRRLMHYLKTEKPLFAAVSGTLNRKRISETHKLVRAALRDSSFLPLQVGRALSWGDVLDSGAAPTPAQKEQLLPLLTWAQEKFPNVDFGTGVDALRRAYQARMATAPGTVCMHSEVDCGLVLDLQPTHRPPGETLEHMVRDVYNGKAPNGDAISYGILVHKWAWELSSGFYNQRLWREPEWYVKHRGMSLDQAKDALEKAKEQLVVENEYQRTLRKWLKDNARAGLDTPALVATSIKNHGAEVVEDEYMASLWFRARDMKWPGMPERYDHPVMVDTFRAEEAVRWVREFKNENLLLWYWHPFFGEAVFNLLREAGLNPLYAPSGLDVQADVLDGAGSSPRPVVISLAYGTGTNLQEFASRAVFLEWPVSSTLCEQAVGRLHRRGQPADEVTTHVSYQTEFDKDSFAASLMHAVFAQQTQGTPQKIVYASYTNLPETRPEEFLRERGHDFPRFDAAMKRAYMELWG